MRKEQIARLFEHLLSQAPTKAGLRIRSEHDLANIIGISRQMARRSLDILVAKGYLVRRHGSGTYVRKAVPQKQAPSWAEVKDYCTLYPGELFADANKITPSKAPLAGSNNLQIGISIQFSVFDSARQAGILGGLQERAEELGHDLVYFSVLDRHRESGKYELSDCDGYISTSSTKSHFRNRYQTTFSQQVPPTIYYGPPEEDGLIYMFYDGADAAARAVKIFQESGRTNIGTINFTSSANYYLDGMRRACQGILHETSSPNYDIQAIKDALDKLWNKSTQIDALYVPSDDLLLTGTCEWLKQRNLKPGDDLSLITFHVKGHELPLYWNFSCMSFNLKQFGKIMLDTLVNSIKTSNSPLVSLTHKAEWQPNETH